MTTTAPIALAVRGLGKDWGPRAAVAAIDLEIRRGECFGILGPNGAGKTTTMSMIAGIVAPSRGRIEVLGIDLGRDPRAAKAKLGLVPQELALYEELSADHNLRYFGALYGLAGARLAGRIAAALAIVGLGDRRHDPVKHYSGGMKRRLNIAIGLVHAPEVLLLDEPSVGVDPQSRNHIFDTVRALRDTGTTVLYTSHYIEEVEALCDRVAILDAGAIVATGSVAELVAAHVTGELELELAGDPTELEAAMLAAAAHGRTTREGSTLRIIPAAQLSVVIGAVEATGVTISRLASRTATLETAFLALTGRALRDAS